MDEVTIKVKADNDANKTWSDIRGEFQKLKPEAQKAGKEIDEALFRGFSQGSNRGAPLIAQAIGGAAPLLAPLLGAAIIGGVGVGVAGIGTAITARRPEVQAAGKDLGKTLMIGLTEDSASFVEPVTRNIAKIGDSFQALRPRIKSIFDNTAGFLDPLVDSATKGFGEVLRGIDALTSKGHPVIDAIGSSFEILGDSVGDAFETISGGSDQAANALETTAEAVGALVRGTGYLVRGFSEVIDVVGYVPEKIGDAERSIGLLEEETGNFARHVATENGILSGAYDALGTSSSAAGDAMMTVNEQMREVYDTQRSLFDSTTTSAEAFDRLKESISRNGKTLDANTEKGRNNREALSNLARALNNNYEAYVRVNGEGIQANGVASSNYNSFIRAARGLGISESAARNYARQLGVIPPRKNTDFYANTHDAAARVNALRNAISNVRGKTVTVRTLIVTENRTFSTAMGSSRDNGRAHGGIVGAQSGMIGDGLTLVGEHGPELVDLPPGSNVHSNPDSERIMASAGGDGGTLVVPVILDGAEIARATLPHYRSMNRNRHGNSAERMFAG